jgi:hypothetical protein
MSRRALAVTVVIFLGSLGPVLAAPPWTETLTQRALTSGFLTRLPPAVSAALGLAKADQGTEVRQLLTKSGHRVRTFNVGVADHGELVVFNVDAHSGSSLAYRLTPQGKLRQAVAYQGGQARALSDAEAQAGFAAEVRFWSVRAHQAPP